MARHPVLQPDGKLAVWGTVVDNFVALDCSEEQAVGALLSWYGPDGVAELHTIVRQCAAGERIFDWWEDWPRRVADALIMNGPDNKTVTLAMQRTTDPMTRRYIEQCVATARAENRADEAQFALADATQRAEAAEAKAMGLTMENVGLTNALEAQNALREAAEAKLAATEWHILRPIEPETPEPARLLAEAQARISELEAQLAAVQDYAEYYADYTWNGDAPERFEDWLNGAAQQQEAQPAIHITRVTRPGPLIDPADFGGVDDTQEEQP